MGPGRASSMKGHPSARGEAAMSTQPVQRPISPLRRRMLEDMAMRGLREATQRDYIRFVESFAAFLGRPPDTATAEDIPPFQGHQAESTPHPPPLTCPVP